MGGVNFTRNRAWWHTAIWDEYGQRHQYVMIIPTFAILLPYYWYGSFMNRDLEQNFAAKMYQLDYEQKRNRLTHNLIMEHFETHVEKVMDILDDVKYNGFEQTFKDYLDNPLYSPYPLEMNGMEGDLSYEKTAELNQLNENDRKANAILQEGGLALNTRKKLMGTIPRRQNPNEPFKHLGVDIPLSVSKEAVSHTTAIPKIGNYVISEEEEEEE